MRQSWTDDRLDDLSRHMDQRFDNVDGEIATLRTETQESNRELRAEFNALNRTLLQVGGGVVVALIGLLVTQL